ncbi:MAG: N-acetyltransferase family protein [Solirubrobacterales bacterium]
MPEVTVRPVRGRRDLKRFVRVPFDVHRDHPNWVPPLIRERMEYLNRSKNPYFGHAEVELFLAERDGEPVGRISAQIDANWDAYRGGNDGQFGFFECMDDPEAATGLFDAATGWLAERGRERALGPMDFTTNDELGIMIEGFEYRPVILEPWHPPYYARLFEENGFTKEIDLLMWHLEMGNLKEGLAFHPAIHDAAQQSLDENGITIRSMRRSDMAAEIARFHEVYNEAWGDNWGFVPLDPDEVEFHAKLLKVILDEDWAMIAERDDGEVVGAALTLPDINQVLPKMKGRLFPLGWLHFLLGRRKIDTVRILALGVRKKWQQTGAAAAMYVRHIETTDPDGVMKGEAGWILETNEPMNRALEGMGGEVRKKFRIYGKPLV